MSMVSQLLEATIQAGTPILYATLGEIVAERSGVLNLGVEGMMIVGALAGFAVSYTTGNPWLGVFAAGLAGMLLASVHGTVCLVFQGNQVVSGLALTIFGVGLANFLGAPLVGVTTAGFSNAPIPILESIPVLGRALFSHDVLVYISFALPLLLWLFLERTSLGLSLRSAGQNPEASAAVGLNPVAMRWLGTLTGGFLAGVGGAYLSLAATHMWTNSMTAGRGWIAVALVIFAFWRPGRAIFGAYLFGAAMSLQLRLQAMGANVPSSFLHMLPYALTVLVLVVSGVRGRGRAAPAALGVNIEPSE
ncbi:ABC transporter permease [Oceanidesulfovibrio indonesiensis]|uniref:ABC transporter permease n=1 Tax=Oceanidesulfovibrio indonesiensis TaxID=54767 RepID=A0A7M3MIR7_9BACT|nr:ABC transporter permease [Oceanidesulfovibrio indonesiensis]TVM19703.1 ABC transporter permease [Oceanidesulfovibrio indonesiensis]